MHLAALPPLELEQPFLAEHPHGLLEEERIAAGVGDERLGELRVRKCGVTRETAQEGCRLLGAEGLQVDGAPPAFPAEEAGRCVIDLGPRRGDERERRARLVCEEI